MVKCRGRVYATILKDQARMGSGEREAGSGESLLDGCRCSMSTMQSAGPPAVIVSCRFHDHQTPDAVSDVHNAELGVNQFAL